VADLSAVSAKRSLRREARHPKLTGSVSRPTDGSSFLEIAKVRQTCFDHAARSGTGNLSREMTRSVRRFILRALVATIVVVAAAIPIGAAATDAAAQTPPQTRTQRQRVALLTADSSTVYMIRMLDGTSLTGRVVGTDGANEIRFATVSFGVIPVRLSEIESAVPGESGTTADGRAQVWFPNPNTTRLLFAPTGRQLKAGDGYFSDYQLFFPGFAYGITDRITIGGGMSIFPTSVENQIFFFTPKFSVLRSEKTNIAVGALVASAGGETSSLLYGVTTLGGRNGSVTGGVGFGSTNGKFSGKPAVLLGFDKRLSRGFGIVSENYLLPNVEDGLLLSIGGRFFGERMAVDVGLFTIPAVANDVPFLPFIGFVRNF